MSKSARYKEAQAKIEEGKAYPPAEAVALAKETSTVKFDASVEVHARLGIDPRKGEQQVRTTVVLPHSAGSTKRVAAFVPQGKEQEAKDAGADLVGGEELVAEIIKTKKVDFDVAVATPDMMAKIAKAAKILGPRGLMPNPKTDTVGTDITKMISELKKGKMAFKNDNTSNIHVTIGKVSLETKQLEENLETFLEALKRAKPSSSKGTYIKSICLTTSMGPSIPLAV